MKFSEFHVGQQIEAGPYRVTQAELQAFASHYDPQWFHTDPQAALQSRYGGLIASGWLTCSIAMRLIVETALAGSESFASPGLSYVKWPAPVRPGDRLALCAQVQEVRHSSKSPDLGILRWRWILSNQDDVEVLDLEAISFFDLSQQGLS